MILSTTPTLEGKTIREYRGIVVGEAILGANVFKDLFAGIRDIIGGRAGAYEKELARAREIAFDELRSAPRRWVPMRWSASTSTTRWWGKAAAC